MIKKLHLILLLLPFATMAQNNFLDFDGINDIVETPAATSTMLANATALTMSCKVYPTRITAGFPDFNGICGYRNEIDFDFYLIQLSSTDLEARFRNSAGVAYTITYTGLTLNQWSQFFLVYNGSTLKLYKNGIEVGSTAASGTVPATPSGYLSIGRIIFQTYNWFHQGYIDEVSIWNKALTQTDIDGIMANSGEILNPSGQSNLKAYYKFNQGIAYGNNVGLTSLNDELGINNGILGNFALNGTSSNWGGAPLAISGMAANEIIVFPIPAREFILISGLTELTHFTIHDTMGRLVKKQAVEPSQPLSVSGLQPGIYFLSSGTWQKKIIVR